VTVLVGTTVIVFTLAGCGPDDGTSGTVSGVTAQAQLPAFDAPCPDVVAAIDAHGAEDVFRHQTEDLLRRTGTMPEVATKVQGASAVIATRDAWSRCSGISEIPTYAQAIVDENPELVPPPSYLAKGVRDVLASDGIHFLDDATDSAVDVLGDAICRRARPLQPLDTPEIASISDEVAANLGVDPTDAAKAFLALATTYCPGLDMSD
jgi:hypothetical protein